MLPFSEDVMVDECVRGREREVMSNLAETEGSRKNARRRGGSGRDRPSGTERVPLCSAEEERVRAGFLQEGEKINR